MTQKKIIEAKDREIYALRHQVSSKDKQLRDKNAEIEIKDAQIISAEMFISYLAQSFPENENEEIVIQKTDLYKFMSKNKVLWRTDEEAKTIILKIQSI